MNIRNYDMIESLKIKKLNLMILNSDLKHNQEFTENQESTENQAYDLELSTFNMKLPNSNTNTSNLNYEQANSSNKKQMRKNITKQLKDVEMYLESLGLCFNSVVLTSLQRKKSILPLRITSKTSSKYVKHDSSLKQEKTKNLNIKRQKKKKKIN